MSGGCPFCGGTEIGNTYGNSCLAMCCMECGAIGPFSEGDKEQSDVWDMALRAWNTRADLMPKVKQLLWANSPFGYTCHSAQTLLGCYYAQWDDETQAYFASLEVGNVEPPIILHPMDVQSLEVAKAAAQADYERRILSALDMNTRANLPATNAQVLANPLVKELVEAAATVHDDGISGMYAIDMRPLEMALAKIKNAANE